jgi:hypothetical protein
MKPVFVQWGARAPQAFLLSTLLAAGLVVAPVAAVARTNAVQAPMHRTAAKMKHETIEQRIAMLHSSLKITPDEESEWAPVAQAMRDNEAAMQALVVETKAKPQPLNAVDDLRTYAQFTRTHMEGLNAVIASFETLYQAMPEEQKATADQVFHKFGVRGQTHTS